MQTNSRKKWGTAIFLAGVLLGLGLAIAAAWGDYEAMAYYDEGAGYAHFGGLKCPTLMSLSETGTVSGIFDNNTDEAIQPYYQVDIAATASTRHMEEQITVPARSSKTVRWTVDANDINLGSFILVKLDVLPVAGYSTREATCGIVVMNLGGLHGEVAFGLWLAVSLLGIATGLVLREAGSEPPTGSALSLRNGLRATGIITLLAMLSGIMGLWLIGLILSALMFLLLVVLLRYAGQ